ncbi:MAG: hypothetical protein ABIX12_09300 [Rubrivivax sp.]
MFHAIVWLDHRSARVLQFDAEHVASERIKAHTHHTRQHGSEVRSEHEFYGEVCEAMKDIEEVVVVGSSTAQADFKHYIEKHRPLVAKNVVGYESGDRPGDPQLVALARQYFAKRERMGADPAT